MWRIQIITLLFVFFVGFSLSGNAQAQLSTLPTTITNLQQVVQVLNSNERVLADVRLEATVCAASDPKIGAAILQDGTDTELFEFGGGLPQLAPGDRIRIDCRRCLLRRREMGAQISILPVVENDGIHARRTTSGGIGLVSGRYPITLEWFNHTHEPSLEVKWHIPGSQLEGFSRSNLFCYEFGEQSTNKLLQFGLQAECYEGNWEQVPDFDLLKPVKTGIVTNFDLNFRSRDEMVGIRFRGFLNVPINGTYGFTTRSADGSLLFVGNPTVPFRKIGNGAAPSPLLATIDEITTNTIQQQWITVEGRLGSLTPTGRGWQLELYSHRNCMLVRIVDGNGLDVSKLLNAKIRVTGVSCGVFQLHGGAILGEIYVASSRGVVIVEEPTIIPTSPSWLIKARQVQSLSLEEAKRGLPVHIFGVVTSKGASFDGWFSIQDNTRGIFVRFRSNSIPMCGDYYEIIGHSGAGDFAPIVVADRAIRLGKGEWPEPSRPTWIALNNGSLDVQWVELRGLVLGVSSNTLSMLLPDGPIDVQVEGPAISSLKALEKNVVSVRGVLFAVWNAAREVRVGRIDMRNASVTVDIPAPSDPFDAVLKTPRDLFLFDPQATPFRRVKVQGVIIYADPTQMFLQEDGAGLRLFPSEQMNLRPGDLVEAAGYPYISRTGVLLREATLRKIGETNLPLAKALTENFSSKEGLDSTRVKIEGRLLGWHSEEGNPVLEMQSGSHLFLARLAQASSISLRNGSQLALEGVFLKLGQNQQTDLEPDSFELLLNSPENIVVLSQPSWWTLKRLLALLGILAFIIFISAIWIMQLRRLVEQRTEQLQREIHEREIAEQQRAIEAERSRIAQDLHDDLGSSLTEISVLANKAQHPHSPEENGENLLSAIVGKTRDLVSALDIIVWAVDPKDNSLQSVADYLCDFADEFLAPAGIGCHFDVPVSLPAVALDGRRRHELFLAAKETLNNVVRHAKATDVEFRLAIEQGEFRIIVIDNGRGFNAASSLTGNGLKNLPRRLSGIGGNYKIESTPGKGTTVTISLRISPLAKNQDAM